MHESSRKLHSSLEVIGGAVDTILPTFKTLHLAHVPYPFIAWNRLFSPHFFRSLPDVRFRRECLHTNDDGAVDLGWVSSDDCNLPSESSVLILLATEYNSARRFKIFQDFRQHSVETDKEVDKIINLKFAEASEEIELAMESKDTVYFNEEAERACAAVSEVLEMYEGPLGKLLENERVAIQRAKGLQIEQLKSELEQLNE